MIALSLITGFLGSGKTTYLRRLIEQYRGRRLVFLVNEFSALDVDGPLLQSAGGDVVSLPGGSIFCACLVTQFVSTLKSIPERFGGDMPVEGVLIEASGIANPNAAVRLLRETGLDAQYALRSIVSIVDPGTFPVLLETLPNLAAQIEASNAVIVNKMDLFDKKAVEAVEEQVYLLNPGARVVRSTYCDVALDLLALPGCRDLDGDYAPCADPNYARFTVRVPAPLDETRLRTALAGAKGVLYRVKGFVPARTGSLYLDYSSSGLVLQPAGAGPRSHKLVIIARAGAYAEARSFVESLKQGEFSA